MRSSQHPSNNDVLRPPAGMDNGQCRPLAITRVQYSCGTPGVISFWQPSPEQLARLNAGKPVALSVLGRTHPPVSLHVDGDPELPV